MSFKKPEGCFKKVSAGSCDIGISYLGIIPALDWFSCTEEAKGRMNEGTKL
jgi:hypothetical protein